jgi:thymidylate synthase (FAD)
MFVADSTYKIETKPNAKDVYEIIESVGRTCYQSVAKDVEGHGERFVRSIVNRGHFGLLEHVLLTVRFEVDRGITHELVRHRHASFAQESSRYCNYSKGKFGSSITVINIDDALENDCTMTEDEKYEAWRVWKEGCVEAEKRYMRMLELGCTPQVARGVLPTSLRSEIVMTANLREWRHFLALRALELTGPVHPQMLEVTRPLYRELLELYPAVFEGIDRRDID